MLRHIYKNQMIQAFRKVGYSKKQAKQIYDKHEAEMLAQNGCLSRIKYGVEEGKRSFKFSGAFVWTHTKQGHKYWAEIHYKLHNKGI